MIRWLRLLFPGLRPLAMPIALLLTLLLPLPSRAQSVNDALSIMRDVAALCPRAYANAHGNSNTHPERLDYIIYAARALKRFDPLFGMNGKRGKANDPSSDAIAYGTGANVRVIDVIRSAGAHNGDPDFIVWNDVTGDGGAGAIYVDPDTWTPKVKCEAAEAGGGSGGGGNGGGTGGPVVTPPAVNLQPVLDSLASVHADILELRAAIAALAPGVAQAASESFNAATRASEIKTAIEVLSATCWIGRVPRAFGGSSEVRFCRPPAP